MNYLLCSYCERKFETAEFEEDEIEYSQKVRKHIKSKSSKGHGNEICPNCGEPLSKCQDIDASGASFACKRR